MPSKTLSLEIRANDAAKIEAAIEGYIEIFEVVEELKGCRVEAGREFSGLDRALCSGIQEK